MPASGDVEGRRPWRWTAPLAVLGIAGGLAVSGATVKAVASPEARLERRIGQVAASDPLLAPLYASRDNRPLWLAGGAVDRERTRLLADLFGRGPTHARPGDWAGRLGAVVTLPPAQAEMEMSRLLAAYAADLRRPAKGSAPIFVDPTLPPAEADLRPVFEADDQASLAAALEGLERLNPIYDGLRAAYRAKPDRRLAINMERTRALPADLGERFVLVDVASSQLWLYEQGRAVHRMKAVVGEVAQPTPMIVGRLRHTVLQPYWNIPEDLARTRFSRLALTQGPATLKAAGIQALSDWTPDAREIAPEAIDWRAVASGKASQRLRQAPGPGNMMGAAKFMLPNALGIYLHDTPDKAAFSRANRTLSAGCVRVEDADLLFRWLHGADRARFSDGRPEQIVPLRAATPVYILYLTARPEGGAVVRGPDIYGWDRAAEA